MQRFFSGRYLLFGAALLTVWIVGRTRSAPTPPDGSWVSVQAASEDVSGGEDEPTQLVTDETIAAKPVTTSREAVAPVEPAANEFANDLDTESVSAEALALKDSFNFEDMPALDSDDELMIEDSMESATDSTQTIESAPAMARVTQINTVSADRAMQNMTRVGNKYATTGETSAVSNNANTHRWRENPYADGDIESEPAFNEPSSEQVSVFESAANVETRVSAATEPARATVADFQRINTGTQPNIAPVAVQLTESVAQQAAHRIEYGKSLSRRGASYNARQEFFGALGVIAQDNDAQTGGTAFTTSLRRAMMAMREVEDFAVTDTESQIGMNVSNVLETHQTRIIADREAKLMTPVQAMQRYFTFAHQQLEFAGGQNVVAAEALFCLGKLHTVMSQHQPQPLDVAKAIVFHRAALASDAGNFRSANELGVLLARSGNLQEAENLVKQSLLIRSAPNAWQNLAKIHQRQGEGQLAQLAHSEFLVSSQVDVPDAMVSPIRWVAKDEFIAMAPADFRESTATTMNNVVPASATTPVTGSPEQRKSLTDRFNWKKWF